MYPVTKSSGALKIVLELLSSALIGNDKVTRNIYPTKAFPALLEFTKECAKYCKKVRMSVVDVIGEENINKSRAIAESLGAEFVCRSYDKGR